MGGEDGKIPIFIMDNAPYHHKRQFLSFSAMKTKKDLIEEMVEKVGVTKIELPAKEGLRDAPLEIDLSEKYTDSLENAPADVAGHTSAAASRETWKWKYADRSTRDGTVPTMKELKETCIAHLRQNKPEALECELQKWMKGKSYEWLWTPAYCPWLQPM